MTDVALGGAQAHEPDPRNAAVQVYLNGHLRPAAEATVSVFDSGFVFGDGVWEGLRVHRGHPAFLDAHLDRLYDSAAAIALAIGMTRDELTDALYGTLAANGMTDGVHVRLMVTRGTKPTLYQDPRLATGPSTVVIVPEYKVPATTSLRLFTVPVRRSPPDVLDPRLNVHSKLPDITAGLHAYAAGADEALMLDPHGFVATCNSTHFFLVRRDQVWTSTDDYCLPGVTRANVLQVCHQAGIEAYQKNFTLAQVYAADEAFVTGTFGGVTPVREIDGRPVGQGQPPGPMVARLRQLYADLVDRDVAARAQERSR